MRRRKNAMKMKTLNLALIAAGVLAVGAAGAFSLNPDWLDRAKAQVLPARAQAAPFAGDVQVAASTPSAAPAAVPMIAGPGQVPDYRAIVQQFGPAVVGITVAGTHRAEGTQQGRGLPPGVEDDPYFQFFKGIPGFGGQGPRGGQPQQPFRGQGSGFILSEDGLILTNAHVVRDAKDVSVKLSDRREFAAKVLGSDPVTDVAVLRIEAKGLPVVRLGDPKQIGVGDPVLAIGSPFGFEQTATQGIVSAKGRSLPGGAVVPFIQTDVAVNPGNSGGPLFDDAGRVIGINSQIYSRSGGYQGLAFAIPIDVALKVKDQIVATGSAQHARLGVTVQDLTQPLADSFGLKRPDGALISSVAPDSAAAKAGLKSGDVVTAVNGDPVVRSGELSSRIGMSTPGEQVQLTVWRDKEPREIKATLGKIEPEGKQAAAVAVEPGKLGLALRPMTPDEKRESRIEQGMVVQSAAGPAARAGIRGGDVLLSINGKPTGSMDEIRSVLQSKPKNVALLVQRDGNRLFVPVQLG